ncbi:hypothetical protein CYMTET_49983 [Cymbomonas tetramitiformis]|uniref:UNC93-like protein MFSD11 n=1 Tax=Cymbomonas tetramitiformis TaxID=36881 RepID=A0AAE0EU02_9CHLO|nr:hypothetical protein CYMTET_49983 [Cymbomonas tetramitiformis]
MAAITEEVVKSESSKDIYPRDADDASGSRQGKSAPRWYLLQFSFSSTMLFAAYLTMQNLLTAVIGDNGFIALAIVYAGMALSSNLGPPVVRHIGLARSFQLSVYAYTFMAVSAAITVKHPKQVWLLFSSSALLGFGAAIYWTAQGAYISSLTTSDQFGEASGTFWGIFSGSGIIGFLISTLMLELMGASDGAVLWTMAGISLLSAASFSFVREWQGAEEGSAAEAPHKSCDAIEDEVHAGASENEKARDAEKLPPPISHPIAGKERSVMVAMTEMLMLFGRREQLLLVFSCLWIGNMESFLWGTVAQEMGSRLASVAFIVNAVTAVGCNFVLGKWSDKVGRVPVALPLMLVSVASTLLAAWGVSMDEDCADASHRAQRSAFLILGAAGFGAADFPFQSQLRAIVGALYEGSPKLEAAYSNMVFCLTSGNVMSFLYGRSLHPTTQAGIVIGITVCAMVTFLCLPFDITWKGSIARDADEVKEEKEKSTPPDHHTQIHHAMDMPSSNNAQL